MVDDGFQEPRILERIRGILPIFEPEEPTQRDRHANPEDRIP